MLKIRPAFGLLACALTLNATPTVAISNDLSDSQDDWADVVGDAPIAASFSTGSSAYNLTSVVVVLSNNDNEMSARAEPANRSQRHAASRRTTGLAKVQRPSLISCSGPCTTVSLWSDNGLAFPNDIGPVSLLAASTTSVLDTALPSSNSGTAQFTFLFSSYPLAANTRYWIVVSSPGNNSVAEWWSTLSPAGTDVTSEYSEFEGTIYLNVVPGNPSEEEAYLMEVNGTLAPPTTPVPPSLTLVLTGLLCAGLYFTRRKLVRTS